MSRSREDVLFDDDGSGYLISVSDLMSGLLFIFIITLMAFVIMYKETTEQLTDAERVRSEMLVKIKEELQKQGVDVEVDERHGILRLSEKAIRFGLGKSTLTNTAQSNLEIIGNVLAKILPCYASNAMTVTDQALNCKSDVIGKLESVFIEGHTDNVPVGKQLAQVYVDNWDLSAKRAIVTYRKMVEGQDILKNIKNTKEQPIFSVSGYGDGRPIPGHEHIEPTDDPVNRRIDLRFIMTPPQAIEPVKVLNDMGVK